LRKKNRRFKYRPEEEEEVTVNLYKDLDLDNFINTEENEV
jgi:hypothetical protein